MNPSAKLSRGDVERIRRDYALGRPTVELAREHSVSFRTIQRIGNGQTWRPEAPEPLPAIAVRVYWALADLVDALDGRVGDGRTYDAVLKDACEVAARYDDTIGQLENMAARQRHVS